MYKVIYRFRDLKDNDYVYEVGVEYPRKGAKATKERIEELASNKNALGKPLIKLIEEKVEKKVEEVKEEKHEEIVVEKPKKKKK